MALQSPTYDPMMLQQVLQALSGQNIMYAGGSNNFNEATGQYTTPPTSIKAPGDTPTLKPGGVPLTGQTSNVVAAAGGNVTATPVASSGAAPADAPGFLPGTNLYSGNTSDLNPFAPPSFRASDFTYVPQSQTEFESGIQVTPERWTTPFGWNSNAAISPVEGNQNQFNFTIKSGDKEGAQWTYQLNPATGNYEPIANSGMLRGFNTTQYGQDVWIPLIMLASAGIGAYFSAGAGAAEGAAGAAAGTGGALPASLGGVEGAVAGSTSASLSSGLGTGFAGTGAVTGTLPSLVPTAAAATGAGAGVAAGAVTGTPTPTSGPVAPTEGGITTTDAATAAGGAEAASEATGGGSSQTPSGSNSQTPVSSPDQFWKNLGGAYNIYQALGGSPVGGSGSNNAGSGTINQTRTEQLQITPEAYMGIVRSLFENPETGLSGIYAAQAAAGGYGGSVAALQTNDLLVRAASEIAKLSAPRVTNTNEIRDLVGGGGGGGLSTGNLVNDIPALIRLIGQISAGSSTQGEQRTAPIAG